MNPNLYKSSWLRVNFVVLALWFLSTGLPAYAQSQASTGQIAGAVLDISGAAVPGATVKAANKQTGLARTTTTGTDGLFRLVLLPTGTYDLSATAPRFSPATLTDVEVVVGETTDAKLTLQVGTVKQEVTVSASAIGVKTTQDAPDSVIGLKGIAGLPINGRRFQDFVTLTPTVLVEPSRSQISISGQRGINGNINIDGVDYNQPFFGGIRGGERSNNVFTIPLESIQEFQVVAAGYSAELGRSTGGIVNAVTKSGTNDIHGSGFYLLRNRRFARNNDFFQQLQTFLNRPVHPAPTQQQWGGSAGGPIKKDKMFIFGAYEQQRVRNSRTVLFDRLVGFTPTPNELEAFNFFQSLQTPYTQTDDGWTYLMRFDDNLSGKHRFNVRYNQSHAEALNAASVGNTVFPTINNALSNNGTEQDRSYTLVGQLASTLTPTVLNELRAQYSREVRPRLANTQQPTVEASTVGRFGTVSFLPTTEFDRRMQFADNLTWIHGHHTVKYGGDYNHLFADQAFGFNQFGRFISLTSGIDAILTALSANPSAGQNRFDSSSFIYQRQLGNLELNLAVDQLAFFVQDSWRFRPNLTFEAGLRWEGQFNPTPDASNPALVNPIQGFLFPSGDTLDPTTIPNNTNQFGPRLGFAWDPTKDNKTVIRGYGGIYYAQTPLLLLTNPVGDFRSTPANLSIQLPLTPPAGNPNNTVYKQLNLIGIDLNTTPLSNLPVVTVQQVQSVAAALGLSSVNPFVGATPEPMANDFHNPRSYQWGIGAEREVRRGLVVGANFEYLKTVHLQRDRDVNLPLPVLRSTAVDPAQRPFFGLPGTPRPISTLGSVTVRESSAKALYRAMTLRTEFRRKWGELGASYTLSKNLSDDDNERDATGVGSTDNQFNLVPEYNYSNIDRRHQFSAHSVFFLPHGFLASSGIRLASGAPVDALMGSDVNQDIFNNDRPYSAPGVPFQRNAFRNLATYTVNTRLQKDFNLGETRRLSFSAEFFNLFNATNILLSGNTVTNYCASPVPPDCGFSAPTNPNFLQVFDANPSSSRKGLYLLNNNPGPPFQAQLGLRFQF